MSASDGLNVVARSERWLVIDKPAGLLSVPGRGPDKQDCAIARVQAMFPHATGPIAVHRLDMETSGLMVVALDAEAHRALSMQFEARTVEKRYEALVRGELERESGEIRLRQRLDVERRPIQIPDDTHGKEAVTRWRVIGRAPGGVTRLALWPETGRTHQLRVACAHGLGAPIMGDSLYGAPSAAAARLMLHATALTFDAPSTGGRSACESPAPF